MDDDRAREGIEHLQAAAREAIAAARALLDVAETLVNDPAAAASVVSAVGSMARAAARATAGSMPSHDSAGAGDDPPDRVERIRVS